MGPAPAEPARRGPGAEPALAGATRAVLLAEHEPEVAELARRYLVRAGLRVTVTTSAEDTMAALTSRSAGLAVLDLTMPGLDARRVRRLLAEPPVPTPAVYLLGASMRPRDLRVSADHCLRRPFSPRMLVSRVLSAAPSSTPPITGPPPITSTPVSTRASAITGNPDASQVPQGQPAPGDLRLDPATRRVRAADRDIALTPAEFALLSALTAQAGRVLTRDRLQAAMGRPSSARAVDVHMAQLRAKLGTELSAAIRTVRGAGYVLDVPRAPAPPSEPTVPSEPGGPPGGAHTAPNRGVPATPLTPPR